MKVMSVTLFSLIIFNIVLAKNTSDSGPTTNSSSLLEEKTKENHKTAEKSINVKGKRPYKKGHEENYGDMVKDIFMPLEDDYQYSLNNSHKQDDVPPPVSNGPKKQKFTEKRQLRTINENNEIYQKPKDLLCTDPKKDSKTTEKTKLNTKIKAKLNTIIKSKPIVRYSTSKDVYNKHKHLLCTNPEETKQAEELMDEAVEHLQYHATSKDGYEFDSKNYLKDINFCKKNHEGQKVVKGRYVKPCSNKYYQVINKIWDPDFTNVFDNIHTKRKIVRVYNPNLVIIQQRYKDFKGHHKYFYALAKKVRISEDQTIIVMTSVNINDGHPSKETFINKVIENANLFKTQINSEDDIRSGQLEKEFLNIGGYLIKKIPSHVSITYIKSMYGNASINKKPIIKKPIIKTDLKRFLHRK
ncbi:fam-a protein [Plasmodium vinckei]|uniref:Fam-a protein n=1 Tax=Plasmodium vinckei TaxID=5860 RepID=A0A6V7SM22_PLAVN|nr:fam-a protein [Plasmodium vinckei]